MPASARAHAQATARARWPSAAGSSAPISTGSAHTVTVARPGSGSSAPKITRMPRTIRPARGANKVMFDPRMAFQYGPAPVIQPARLQALFLELVQIDSLSRREGRIAARLARELAELGAEVSFDGAGAEIGGETGNLIAHVPGTVDAPALLLCAPTDTGEPGVGVRPVVEDDVIRSDGTTVLGGDDKSGVAIVCECVRACREGSFRHPPLDVVFTVCDEVGLLGARHLDFARLRARSGLVFDSDAVGFAFTRAPGANLIEAVVRGRA